MGEYERTQQVQYNKIYMVHALTGEWANACFRNNFLYLFIFILESYVRQFSQVNQTIIEFLSRRVRSSFPE
jgi:hypothetical protein